MKTEFPFTTDRACRSKRMDTIVEILAREPLLTILEIGHRLGLKKTPYLREMIIELVGQERVVYQWRYSESGPPAMVFRVFHHEETEDPDPEETNPEHDIDRYQYDENWAEETGRPYPQDELPGSESGFPSVFVDEDLQHQMEEHPDWPLPNDFAANPL